jgi:hypothetical protein
VLHKDSMKHDSSPPSVSTLTSAPRRNHLRVELRAPVPDVWALVGDVGRLPDLGETAVTGQRARR